MVADKLSTEVQKTPQYYFLNNSIKNEPIFIIFGTPNTEGICINDYELDHHT